MFRQICTTVFILLFSLHVFAQKDHALVVSGNEKFRKELNQEFSTKDHSPLEKKAFRKFKGLPFFDIDTAFYVIASFERVQNAKPFNMPTTTGRIAVYEVFGIVSFEISGKTYRLNVYQNHALRNKPGYEKYLFLPFTDATNGETTYGGGRFMDLRIPNSDVIVIDFNKAYNPYCAYSARFSCPITPKENNLPIAIKAGVQYQEH